MKTLYVLILKQKRAWTQPLVSGLLTIGRMTYNDLVLDDPSVSNIHARLYLRGKRLYVEDLGSTNGSYISGYELQRGQLVPLSQFEQLHLGEVALRLMVTRHSSLHLSKDRLCAYVRETKADRGRAQGEVRREVIRIKTTSTKNIISQGGTLPCDEQPAQPGSPVILSGTGVGLV